MFLLKINNNDNDKQFWINVYYLLVFWVTGNVLDLQHILISSQNSWLQMEALLGHYVTFYFVFVAFLISADMDENEEVESCSIYPVRCYSTLCMCFTFWKNHILCPNVWVYHDLIMIWVFLFFLTRFGKENKFCKHCAILAIHWINGPSRNLIEHLTSTG